jgi:thiol-disulfide isomerase/thioredoxin
MKKAIVILLAALLVLTGCVNVKRFGEEPLPTVTEAPKADPTAAPAAVEAPTATEAPVSETAAPAAPAADPSARDFAFPFTAVTLDGETVTEAFFQEYDLVMVNVWASWCGPCRAELPELGELYGKLPQGVGFLSVTIDDPADLRDAKALLQQNGCTFPCLDITSSQELSDEILSQVMAIPATLFFDRSGNLVGNMVIGAPERNGSVVEGYLYEIQNRLAQVNGK